jgi:hypothetical protein
MSYGGNNPNALPGIIDLGEQQNSKEFYKIIPEPHKDYFALSNETRMPLDHIISQGNFQYVSPQKHIEQV